ncbi:universal stress protein, partial [Cellulomonas sp. P5_C6]
MRTDGPVVVALDGSPNSAHTLEWGVAEAVRRRADVLLTRVIDDAWQAMAWSWYPVIDTGDGGAEVEEYLAEQRVHVREHHPGVTVRVRVLHGQVVPALRELSVDAQLLVVGARPRYGRGRTGATGSHL